MAKCAVCDQKEGKYKLTNARHLTGKLACKDCYQTMNEDDRQSYLFDAPTELVSYDFDKALDGNEFKSFLEDQLGYEKQADFFEEIGMNPRSAVQTWKKKGEIPFLAKEYLKNKIDKINNIENGKTRFVEVTKIDTQLEQKAKELERQLEDLKYSDAIIDNIKKAAYNNEPNNYSCKYQQAIYKLYRKYAVLEYQNRMMNENFKTLEKETSKRVSNLQGTTTSTLAMNDEELIQTVYAIKKGINSMWYHRKHDWVSKPKRTKETKRLKYSKIRSMIGYLKRLYKYYDINNRKELELIHSTLIKYDDLSRFFNKYYLGNSHAKILGVDSGFKGNKIWTTRLDNIWLNFESSTSSLTYIDLLRYATNKAKD